MKAVIMAAGKSTRTYPLTLTRPKPLLPVANKTILERQAEALSAVADGLVLVVGYRSDMIRARFGASLNGMPVEYVEQTEQLGTGHAVLQCAKNIDGPFLVVNGDDLYAANDLARLAEPEQAALVLDVPDPRAYGIYETTPDGRVIRLVEKPKEIFSTLANIGAYKFTPAVFDVLRETPRSERGEIEITSAVQTLADRGDFRVVDAREYWLPIGYPWKLLEANRYWMDHFFVEKNEAQVSPLADIQGPVSIGRGTVVKAGVVIEGPVVIGEDCVLGPNCWIRPYSAIGNHCRVGQGSEIKGSVLFDHAAAPHQNYVGDSILGEYVNLGCGTVTANLRHDHTNVRSMSGGNLVDTGHEKLGAVLGDHAHTGIHTAIYPGRQIWPHVTTRPGQVVDRDLRDTGTSA